MHSHTYQHCLKVLDNNWKAYFNAKKEYEKNRAKFKGEPRQPRYKNTENKKNEVIFTNYAIRIRKNTVILSLSKKIQDIFKVKSLNIVISDKLQDQINISKIQQVKLKYSRVYKKWEIIVIYEKEEKIIIEDNNIMAVDLGLNNLVALTNLDTIETMIIKGTPIKSINRYINERISALQSIEMKRTSNKKYKTTKRIKKLKEYRENYIKDYLHKTSKQVIEYGKRNGCSKIVIGDIKNIKQEMNYNKNFVEIPIQKLVEYITYKARLEGMEVIKIKEQYTSGVSSLDLEEIDKSNYNKKRRITRGLFRSNKGIIINADINGSLNILRKYSKSIPKYIEYTMDNGCTSIQVKSLIA